MADSTQLTCPKCHGNQFIMKYEASYVYSYRLDDDAPGKYNVEEFRSYVYDNREQKDSKQYLECQTCGATFPCYCDEWPTHIKKADLQAVLHMD